MLPLLSLVQVVLEVRGMPYNLTLIDLPGEGCMRLKFVCTALPVRSYDIFYKCVRQHHQFN
eukprot:1147489-Pelagomonas_calceolata.AAC.2